MNHAAAATTATTAATTSERTVIATVAMRAKGVRYMKNHDQFHDGVLEALWIDGTIVHVFLSRESPFTVYTIIENGLIA